MTTRRKKIDDDDPMVLVEYSENTGYSTSLVVMGKKLSHFCGNEHHSQSQARGLAERVAAELGCEVKDKTKNIIDRVQRSSF